MSVDKPILLALQKKVPSRVPVWFMRQAGRYLPEYREVRKQAGSFLDLCYNPELASEVTLQPIRRFGMDGAILFSDILVLPHALGVEVRFAEGEGPIVERVITRDRVEKLQHAALPSHIGPVLETIRRVKAGLPEQVTLLGFAGAPFTVASYMVEGKGSKDHQQLREFLYKEPELFQLLIDHITRATVTYLSMQIEAGAEAVQLFDSWAGVLAPDAFAKYVVEPNLRIVEALKRKHPETPVICFPRGAGAKYLSFCEVVPCDGIGVDTMTPLVSLKDVWNKQCLQGNIDPALVVAGGQAMTDEAKRMLEVMDGSPFIFNLGHGFVPHTPIAHVEALMEVIRNHKVQTA